MFTWLTLGFLLASPLASSAGKKCCSNGDCYDKSKPFNSFIIPLPSCPEVIQPEFHLYTRTDQNTPQAFDRYTIPTAYDGSKRTFFLIHGYRNDIETSWLTEMKDALLLREDLNVVLVGWGKGASILNYFKAVANTRVIGAEVAHIVANLVANGETTFAKMWCVGHSLGSHACGHAGKKQKLGRITGLDPAGPTWDDLDLSAGLIKEDADFVEAIHTHGQELVPWGTIQARGHVDFYPNAARIQPGCLTYDANPKNVFMAKRLLSKRNPYSGEEYGGSHPSSRSIISCSHSRSVEYFMSSINDPCFTATFKCKDPRTMPSDCEVCHNCPQMGYSKEDSTSNPRGNHAEGMYYLKTSSSAPFCP